MIERRFTSHSTAMKQVTIIRGLPGSGKTTFAEDYASLLDLAGRDTLVIGADDCVLYYDNEGGEYHFTEEVYDAAHGWMRANVIAAMQNGTEHIVLHEVFGPTREFAWVEDAAERHGYRVVSLVVENRHGGESVHNVPSETIARMHDDFDLRLCDPSHLDR